ncbi:MAG: hypothetical protein ACTH31_14910 [Pseudoclavibacter sp.]
MKHRLAAATERVAFGPAVSWPVPVVVVDGTGIPVGFVGPGEMNGGTFSGGALDDDLEVRQLRTSSFTAICEFVHVPVGGSGAGLERLTVSLSAVLDGHDDWRALERVLREVAEAGAARGPGGAGGNPPDAPGAASGRVTMTWGSAHDDGGDDGDGDDGADPIDDALVRSLGDSLDSYVRDALRAADAGRARDESLAHALAPGQPTNSNPATLTGPFAVFDVRVVRATWASGVLDAAAADLRVATDDGDVRGASGAWGADVDGGSSASGGAGSSGLAVAGAPQEDLADQPLADVLGSNAALAGVWARETGGDQVTAISGVVHGDGATVMVLHPDPTKAALAYTGGLAAALGAELRTGPPRVIVLAEAPTLRELVQQWLDEQAIPGGIVAATVVDAGQSRVVIEVSGPGDAEFVERIADESQADLSALGSLLPWRVVLRAAGDDGLVEADSAGTALRRGDAGVAGAADARETAAARAASDRAGGQGVSEIGVASGAHGDGGGEGAVWPTAGAVGQGGADLTWHADDGEAPVSWPETDGQIAEWPVAAWPQADEQADEQAAGEEVEDACRPTFASKPAMPHRRDFAALCRSPRRRPTSSAGSVARSSRARLRS